MQACFGSTQDIISLVVGLERLGIKAIQPGDNILRGSKTRLACVDPNQKSFLAWIQTKKLACVDPNQKSCLVWIQTKKLACVDPNFTSVDLNPKLSLCGSKTKNVTCVDPKQKKSELVWIQNQK